MYYLIPLITFVMAFLMLFLMLKGNAARFAMDYPNDRSLHSVPVPRTGGLAVITSVIFGWVLLWQSWLLPVACGVVLMMLVSFYDDLRGLAVGWRLSAHFLIAGVFAVFGFSMTMTGLWLFLGVIAIVWMTNLYNFMDGSDGLAGGMALFGFGSYAVAAWLAGDTEFFMASLCLMTAALAFLRFNFYPARIFLGDVGSIPLGFIAAALGLLGWQRGIWPLWFPVLVFSPFIVDATVTLFKRVVGREKFWQAHYSHYYQRLVRMGWGHRNTAIVEYCLMLAVGASAIVCIRQPIETQRACMLGWLGIYILCALRINRLWCARNDR